MVIFPAGFPIPVEDFSSSVRVAIGLLLTSLTKATQARLLRLTGWPALGRVHNDGAPFKNALNSLSMSHHNWITEVYGEFFELHGLDLSLT